MPPRPPGPQHGLFDNPVRAFRLEELTETVQELERRHPGRTVDELTTAVFAELAMKRTRRAADLVAEAIRIARARRPRAEITATRWQAGTSEVREWQPPTASRPAPTASSPNRQSWPTTRHVPTGHTDQTPQL